MDDAAIPSLAAGAIARLVGAREVSARRVVEAHLARIQAVNPTVNALCTIDADGARRQAAELDRALALGIKAGPLAGVPVGVKDITPVAGLRTTYGSTLFEHHVPGEDALIVDRLRRAGAIVIGKTNTSEFAAGANTFNAVFGATRNPWNPALSASGSTGGGASALAARMIALADGSDLGGSLRTPAAFCGVVGLRPTPGLVPIAPNPAPWDTLNVIGPMARSVDDVALMLDAIAGRSPRAPLGATDRDRDFPAAARRALPRGLRLGYAADLARIGVDAEIESACRRAAFALADRADVRAAFALADRADVRAVDLDLSFARPGFLQLRGQWMVDQHRERLNALDRLGPNLAGNIRMGLAQTPRDIADGQAAREAVRARMAALFDAHDYLLAPVTAVMPFPVERNHPDAIAGVPLTSYIDWVAPTFLISLAGTPALSLPCALSAAGLPIGIQVIGRWHDEEGVLSLGAAIERAFRCPAPPRAH